MKVTINVPDEIVNVAVALLTADAKTPGDKADLQTALAKARESESVEIDPELLDGDDSDTKAFFLAMSYAAIATCGKNL